MRNPADKNDLDVRGFLRDYRWCLRKTGGPFYTNKIEEPYDFEESHDACAKAGNVTLEANTDAMREVRLEIGKEG